ncbi:hypothetical protein GCM10022416_35160 [Actinomadura keratinilytica]|jgi:hypothetical protein|uniref:Uncharacterized protein n=1 Tax=Actinomadura keratinilytica TaxID=547461 RepID=A0ABP7YZR2_9ACTN
MRDLLDKARRDLRTVRESRPSGPPPLGGPDAGCVRDRHDAGQVYAGQRQNRPEDGKDAFRA